MEKGHTSKDVVRRKGRKNKRKKWYELKKKFLSAGVALGLFLGGALVTYALTSFFTKGEITLNPTPTHIFEIKMDAGDQPGEIGPGDSFSTNPIIENDATEEMYVFLRVSDGGLYEFEIGEGWVEIEEGVYAYGGEEMVALQPGESTSPLTSALKMREMSRAEFSTLENISIKITGYAIGTEGVPAVPSEAWEVCKSIGRIE